jgi:hypothetical protein
MSDDDRDELVERYKVAYRNELIERYKIAYAEYRAEVALGHERQKLFITLNPAVAALSAVGRPVTALVFGLAALASLIGIVLVYRSHGRYRQARDVLMALAIELGCSQDWQTTGGMREARGEPRFEGPRVVTAIALLLFLYACFDVAAIVMAK